MSEFKGSCEPDGSKEKDIFEIHDYTNASPLEKFAAMVEAKLLAWGLANGLVPFSQGESQSATLFQDRHRYLLQYVCPAKGNKRPFFTSKPPDSQVLSTALPHSSSSSSSSSSSDSSVNTNVDIPNIGRLFGMSYYVVLSCLGRDNRPMSIDDGKSRFLLSALSIAAMEGKCIVPVFVYNGSNSAAPFRGKCFKQSAYDVAFGLDTSDLGAPATLKYLSGLVDYYRNEVASRSLLNQYSDMVTERQKLDAMRSGMDTEAITLITCSHTYTQSSDSWVGYLEMDQRAEQSSGGVDSKLGPNDASRPTYGSSVSDQVDERFECLWRNTHLDRLTSFGCFWGCKYDPLRTIDLVCKWPYFPEGDFVENAVYSDFDPHAAPIWMLKVHWKRDVHYLDAPMTNSVLKLAHLLEQAKPIQSFTEVTSPEDLLTPSGEQMKAYVQVLFAGRSDEKVNRACKPGDACVLPDLACPFGSLFSRLVFQVMKMEVANAKLTLRAVSVLWTLFCEEVRARFEAQKDLPFMEQADGHMPDFRHCVVQQKLELLQRCVMDLRKDGASGDGEEGKERESMGRAHLLGEKEKIFLFEHPDVALYVPMCQSHKVMTSDVFTEQEDLLARLGSDAEAVKIKTQLQSGSLFSDMRSFKAANPQGDMRDFVRWYSPKDVCVETGELSMRMRDTANAWHQLWQNADACVEWKQEKLFDAFVEGEQVLGWMESVLPSTLLNELIVVAKANVLQALARTDGPISNKTPAIMRELREVHAHIRSEDVKSVCQLLAHAEVGCARVTSLMYCFPFSARMVNSLFSSGSVLVQQDSERTEVLELFCDEAEDAEQSRHPDHATPNAKKFVFAPAESREYIVLTRAAPGSVGEAQQRVWGPYEPNRLHARILPDGHFELASTWNTQTP